jgi:hypothetical protein
VTAPHPDLSRRRFLTRAGLTLGAVPLIGLARVEDALAAPPPTVYDVTAYGGTHGLEVRGDVLTGSAGSRLGFFGSPPQERGARGRSAISRNCETSARAPTSPRFGRCWGRWSATFSATGS